MFRTPRTDFGIDSDRVVLGGFSAGAFMVYYLACDAPDTFSAYVPVSRVGSGVRTRRPANGPVRMFHTHGWTDNVVPLEGAAIWEVADSIKATSFAGLEIWRVANGCVDTKPSGLWSTTDQFMRRYWTGCAEGGALEFALFPGGHTVPKGWADMMVDWYEGLPGG